MEHFHKYSSKLKNLVLYVLSKKTYNDEGIKKLNKILYFIDFYFYKKHEKLISDVNYAKAERGPIIDNYKAIFTELVQEGVLSFDSSKGPILFSPQQSPNLSAFTADEIAHIDDILEKYGRLTSKELESISHSQQPWILTEKYGDIIDPDLALLIDDTTIDTEITEVSTNLKEELEKIANSVPL